MGGFPPNGYGLFDMAGNVWEWTSDYFIPARRWRAGGYGASRRCARTGPRRWPRWGWRWRSPWCCPGSSTTSAGRGSPTTTPLLFGAFIATFTFALVTLSQVSQASVPSISVALAVLLVMVSSGLFLRLLVTFRTRLTTGGLVRSVGGELRKLITVLYPAAYDPAHEARTSAGPGAPSWRLAHAGPPGVFQAFDETAVAGRERPDQRRPGPGPARRHHAPAAHPAPRRRRAA